MFSCASRGNTGIGRTLRVALEDICARALPVTLDETVYVVFKERNLTVVGALRTDEKARLAGIK